MMRPFDQDQEEEEARQENEEEHGENKESEEAARAKMVRAGYNPTQREIYEHRITHLPFRAWCVHCVKGKAKGLAHRKVKHEDKHEELVPVISVDFMFWQTDKQKMRKKVCQCS